MTIETGISGGALRILADMYEQTQDRRKKAAEQIRAIAQGRDKSMEIQGVVVPDPAAPDDPKKASWIDDEGGGEMYTSDDLMPAIVRGDTAGPVPFLGRAYRRYLKEEDEHREDMLGALEAHPAWPWLESVKGIGPTLACKLLARIDVRKAPHVSSVWKHAGLATVPGELFRCPLCELERRFPVGTNVTGKHTVRGSTRACKEKLVKVAGPEDGIRSAEKPVKGRRPGHDVVLKKVLYVVGGQFLKAASPYARIYRKERARLEVERPYWSDGNRHMAALRKMNKLFLSHLWQVNRRALGLPTPHPWALEHGGHGTDGLIQPEEMVE